MFEYVLEFSANTICSSRRINDYATIQIEINVCILYHRIINFCCMNVSLHIFYKYIFIYFIWRSEPFLCLLSVHIYHVSYYAFQVFNFFVYLSLNYTKHLTIPKLKKRVNSMKVYQPFKNKSNKNNSWKLSTHSSDILLTLLNNYLHKIFITFHVVDCFKYLWVGISVITTVDSGTPLYAIAPEKCD